MHSLEFLHIPSVFNCLSLGHKSSVSDLTVWYFNANGFIRDYLPYIVDTGRIEAGSPGGIWIYLVSISVEGVHDI